MTAPRLIETDRFPIEFISKLAERESWRKEVHRPIYHVHKWWAKRLGSVFRGALLGCVLPADASLEEAFYERHDFAGVTVFEPFMGSGTTVGEAHKLGCTAVGRDINPVACEAVRVALGPLDRERLLCAFEQLSAAVGERVRGLYRTTDASGNPADVLYHFWVHTLPCPKWYQRGALRRVHDQPGVVLDGLSHAAVGQARPAETSRVDHGATQRRAAYASTQIQRTCALPGPCRCRLRCARTWAAAATLPVRSAGVRSPSLGAATTRSPSGVSVTRLVAHAAALRRASRGRVERCREGAVQEDESRVCLRLTGTTGGG